ncbi:hypothetical protein [Nesterenkonia pannonica]|nr:hypothetical protein [Nesterenkonia pannonica]
MIRSLIAQTRRRGGDGPVTAETLNDLQKDLAARSLRRIIAEER